jgi:hypothetical protein
VITAALLLPLALAGAAAPPPPVAFPGASVAKDPSGRFAIELARGEGGRSELRLTTLSSGDQ